MNVAFLGPSLPASEARRALSCRVLPPARAGDVWRALRFKPRVIVLIDGVFESQPSVWHREILDAMDAGVAVFGAASMGALRAAELWRLGMVGVGDIFAAYRDGRLVDDAEVALLHAGREHGYRALTVPLVNVRHDAARAAKAKVLSAAEARRVVRGAEGIFYQARSWPAVLEAAGLPERARRAFAGFPHQDLKALDARACLAAAAAFAKHPSAPVSFAFPRPPAHARQARAALGVPEGDGVPALRRHLLASFARSLGLEAPADPGLVATLSRQGWSGSRAARLAGDVALEELALAHASRLMNDGPSWAEACEEQAALSRTKGS